MRAKQKVKIAGIPVTIVPDEEAENCDYLVCAPWGPSPFTDNFKGVCSRCGVAVMYRWHAPAQAEARLLGMRRKAGGGFVSCGEKPLVLKAAWGV